MHSNPRDFNLPWSFPFVYNITSLILKGGSGVVSFHSNFKLPNLFQSVFFFLTDSVEA